MSVSHSATGIDLIRQRGACILQSALRGHVSALLRADIPRQPEHRRQAFRRGWRHGNRLPRIDTRPLDLRPKPTNSTRSSRRARSTSTTWSFRMMTRGQSGPTSAVCAETKLIFAYHLGDRGLTDATIFARVVASKLKRKPDGQFAVRPTIITDGLAAYPDAVGAAFGSDVNFGVMTKKYSKTDINGNQLPGSRYQGADRAVKQGAVDPGDFHNPAHRAPESQMCAAEEVIRPEDQRLEETGELRALYPRCGSCTTTAGCPAPPFFQAPPTAPGPRDLPAAMAGLTKSLWEVEDLWRDAYAARAKWCRSSSLGGRPCIVERALPTNSNWRRRTGSTSLQPHAAKVHRAGCANCRDGPGSGRVEID